MKLPLSAAMSFTNRKWKVGRMAQFTIFSRMQTAQRLTALNSPIKQQTDYFILGRYFLNSWHLAEDTRINCDPGNLKENFENPPRLIKVSIFNMFIIVLKGKISFHETSVSSIYVMIFFYLFRNHKIQVEARKLLSP